MINLIIHGQIVSRTSYRSKRCYEIKGKEPVYNALENIKNILFRYSDVFENIIISTWDCSNEIKKELDHIKNKYNIHILYFEPGHLKNHFGKLTTQDIFNILKYFRL